MSLEDADIANERQHPTARLLFEVPQSEGLGTFLGVFSLLRNRDFDIQ